MPLEPFLCRRAHCIVAEHGPGGHATGRVVEGVGNLINLKQTVADGSESLHLMKYAAVDEPEESDDLRCVQTSKKRTSAAPWAGPQAW